jgi:hypothetical protein
MVANQRGPVPGLNGFKRADGLGARKGVQMLVNAAVKALWRNIIRPYLLARTVTTV